MKFKLKLLNEHDWNKEVFFDIVGAEYDSLKSDIKERGLQLPIHITSDNQIGRHKPFTIINGHQRARVFKELGFDEIEVVVRNDLNVEDKIDEQFISDNVLRRHLNPIQIANASDKLLEIEARRAEERMLGGKKIDPKENLPEGQARDLVAKKLGISGKTLDTYRGARDIASKNKKTMQDLVSGKKSAHSIVHEVKQKELKLRNNTPIYSLPFRLKHKKLIEDGKKIQTSRIKWVIGAEQGALGKANVVEPIGLVRINSIEDKKLGEFTKDDAEREGYASLDEFKKVWEDLHGNWNSNLLVRVYIFEMVKDGKGN